ncbi:PQQ-dependent sugar dehydrogenase [Komagataeibacter kakiaceti]|uniref:PQQ-dependent sugar dehydrogenase n=1 Tax=Komagataeibacter kakiaceti TaxID=943261 RepID=UPI00131F0FEA|nr:PQQ-dependent sugar dehydrogenase [Komagataeibacter kakiaceti]
MAFHEGDLYVSDMNRIVVLRDIENHLDTPPRPEPVGAELPYRPGDHSWKFIAFGPDNRLYVPIGAPCNICDVGHEFGRIISMAPDGTDRRDVAFGIRNSVGLTWRPGTDTLWFTDNGRDNMGDDVPADELNRLDRVGQSFGYPYCHQAMCRTRNSAGSTHAANSRRPPCCWARMSRRWGCGFMKAASFQPPITQHHDCRTWIMEPQPACGVIR